MLIPFFRILCILGTSRLDEEGRIAIVTTREARMRWMLWRRARRFVRTDGAGAFAKSCGPGIPTLMPSFVRTKRELTVANKPGPRGDHV
jgi:hypothetical protein